MQPLRNNHFLFLIIVQSVSFKRFFNGPKSVFPLQLVHLAIIKNAYLAIFKTLHTLV